MSSERAVVATLDHNGGVGMLLTTNDPFDKHLRVRVGMMLLVHEKLKGFQLLRHRRHGAIFEMWPYPIFQVVLSDRRLMDENESVACVE